MLNHSRPSISHSRRKRNCVGFIYNCVPDGIVLINVRRLEWPDQFEHTRVCVLLLLRQWGTTERHIATQPSERTSRKLLRFFRRVFISIVKNNWTLILLNDVISKMLSRRCKGVRTCFGNKIHTLSISYCLLGPVISAAAWCAERAMAAASSFPMGPKARTLSPLSAWFLPKTELPAHELLSGKWRKFLQNLTSRLILVPLVFDNLPQC